MSESKHSEYHYTSEASDTVIVFIHGIQGSPSQFDYLIKALNGIYSIENLLLPGHGKTAKEFIESNITQWQDYADERIKKLQEAYKNIILVGHSMGCLLAVQSAVLYPRQIRGLFLIATPLSIRVRGSYIRNNFMAAFSKNNKSEAVAAAKKGNSVLTAHPSEYLAGMPRYIEVIKKGRSTRELLGKLQMPVVMVQSENDEIVSIKSLRYAEKRQNIRVMTARNSGHYHYAREAQGQISDTLIKFIAETTAG